MVERCRLHHLVLGREVTRFHDCFGLLAERCDLFAEAGQQVPQPLVETVLREAVALLPNVTLAIGCALTGLVETTDNVTVEVTSGDEVLSMRALYVLGCDGSNNRPKPGSCGHHRLHLADVPTQHELHKIRGNSTATMCR